MKNEKQKKKYFYQFFRITEGQIKYAIGHNFFFSFQIYLIIFYFLITLHRLVIIIKIIINFNSKIVRNVGKINFPLFFNLYFKCSLLKKLCS